MGKAGKASRARAALLALWLACGGAPPLQAQDAAPPTLTLELPRDLRVGQHARVLLTVHVPPAAERPLLVTPFREGAALEIVKGRLLRSDALDPAERPLRFELPLLALAPGAAVIGARVLTYVCGAQHCRALEAETRANLIVLPR